jgi:hypothetical protein
MMTTSGATDRTTSSTNELGEGTVSVDDPIGTAAKSVSSPLTANDGPGATGAPVGASGTVLPTEPVHLIHAIPGLDVRYT